MAADEPGSTGYEDRLPIQTSWLLPFRQREAAINGLARRAGTIAADGDSTADGVHDATELRLR